MENLPELVNLFLLAKKREELAIKERSELGNKIADLCPGPDIGAKTFQVTEDIKVTIERGYNYKADITEIQNLFATSNQASPVKTKTTIELDVKGYEWYRTNNKEMFDSMTRFVTVTPKKVSIQVKTK